MFYFKVEYVDASTNEARQECGLIGEATYVSAMQYLSEYYDMNAVISVYLEQWENLLTAKDITSAFATPTVRLN